MTKITMKWHVLKKSTLFDWVEEWVHERFGQDGFLSQRDGVIRYTLEFDGTMPKALEAVCHAYNGFPHPGYEPSAVTLRERAV